MSKSKPTGYVYGKAEPKPLKDWPEGEVEIVTAKNAYAYGVVTRLKHPRREFFIREVGGHWVPGRERAL